jgi:hypothetical protein
MLSNNFNNRQSDYKEQVSLKKLEGGQDHPLQEE